jgi:hypothetical protein
VEGREEVLVGELGVGEVGGGAGAPQEGAEGGQAELGAAGVELAEDEVEAVPEVAVGAATAALGEPAQAGGRVEASVAGVGVGGGGGVEEQAAVLGDEQEDQAVREAQELAVVVLGGELAGAQGGGSRCRGSRWPA